MEVVLTKNYTLTKSHLVAMANVLQVPIVILDQMAPADNVAVFTPESRSFAPTTRSWEREIIPALQERCGMIILHWVMSRQHYEPVIPLINNPGTLRAEDKRGELGNKRRIGALGGHTRQGGKQWSNKILLMPNMLKAKGFGYGFGLCIEY